MEDTAHMDVATRRCVFVRVNLGAGRTGCGIEFIGNGIGMRPYHADLGVVNQRKSCKSSGEVEESTSLLVLLSGARWKINLGAQP